VAAAGAILATLVAGLGFSVAMYIREREARAESEQAATRSNQVATFLGDMLSAAGPSKAQGRDSAMLQDILDTTAERLGRELGHFPEVEAELRSVLGSTYEDLMQYEKAEAMHRLAWRLRRSFLASEHPQVIQSMVELASALHLQDELNESEALLRQCLKLQEGSAEIGKKARFKTLDMLAWIRFRQGDLTEAEGFGNRAIAVAQAMGEKGKPYARSALSTLGAVFDKKCRFSEAVATQRQALELARQLEGELHPSTVSCMNNLCHALVKEGSFDEVLETASAAMAIERKIYGKPVCKCTHALTKAIANVHEYRGEIDKAIELYQSAIQAATEVYGANHRFTNDKRALLIRACVRAGRLDDADQALGEAEAVGAKDSADTSFLSATAMLKLARNDVATAESLARADVQRATSESGVPSTGLAEAQRALAAVRLAQNRPVDAERLLRDSLAILNPELNPNSPLVAEAMSELAKVLRFLDASSTEAAELEKEVVSVRENDWKPD
jgi:tetratricopeptide (TPR) repeat protein